MRTERRTRVVIAAAALLVLAGSAARFIHLDRHFYFHDEAATSLRISGYTAADFGRAVTGREITAAQIQPFQRNTDRGLADTVHSLAVNDPQHPPLFFILARLWAGVAGASITSLRALSALFSLLALACAGWLVRELFGSWRTTWIAVALLAISPFQLLYAQEAREYSLWVATVAASSAALLIALRSSSARAWIFYALTLATALYTFPNTALVALGHAIFLLLQPRGRQVFWRFVAAVAGAFVLFVPWIGVMVLERGAFRAGTDWTTASVPFSTLLRSWLVVFGLGVVDKKEGAVSVTVLQGLLFAAVIVVEVAALVVLRLRGPRSAWLFVASLIAASAAPLMLADIAAGGIRSAIPRYLAPVYLGLSIALAFLLSYSLAARSAGIRALASLLALATVGVAAVSYAGNTGARVWWNQDDGAAPQNLAVSRALNRLDRPLLISTGVGTLLEMSHYLRPQTRIRVVLDGREPPLGRGFREVLLYGSPANPAAASRLAALLRDIRRRRAQTLRPLSLVLPCCGAGTTPIPRQLWQLRPLR
jgi:uncharacterized membrane protein